MNYYAGLDVSLEETNVCEGKALSEPAAIASFFLRADYKRIGIEACPLSQWLYQGLRAKNLPAICVDARHMTASLSAMRNSEADQKMIR